MIYLSKGFKTKRMKKHDVDAFQFLWEYQPDYFPITESLDVDSAKKFKDQCFYFLGGHLKQGVRSNENLTTKDLIVLDYDGLKIPYTKFLNTVTEKLKDSAFMIYPTLRNYVKDAGMRFRVVIKTDREYTIDENKTLLTNVIEWIGIPCDSASQTYSQCMGVPVITDISPASLITRHDGNPLEVDAWLYEPTPKKDYHKPTFTGELTHDTAVAMVQAYADRLKDKLADRDYFIKPYLNIKYNYEIGALDLATVEECLTILAVGNDDWASDNIKHFKHDKAHVKNGTPFTDFFGWAVRDSVEADFGDLSDGEINKGPVEPPKNMKELYKVLKDEGFSWREEHTTFDRDGKPKVPTVSPRAVANILKKYVHFAVVADDDPEAAPLCAYDLDEGIYKRGERFIGKLILAVESTINKMGRTNIMGWLEIESPEKMQTRDDTLVVMNNGIFDRMQMRLVPFTPNYIFLTKIATNYNPDAIEPTFSDWSFSSWLEELSDGNPQKIEQIWRIIYACINGNYNSQKVVFFYSEKSKTGKGTLQNLLRNLVGVKNTAAIRLGQLETRWGVYNSVGKTLMIGDDNNPKEFIKSSENLKSISVGEYVLAEGKGQNAFFISITAQIIQSFNGFPRINAFDDGFKTRLILVPFTHTYKHSENRKVKLEYIKNRQLLEWIASKAVRMEQVELFNTIDGEEALTDFEEDNNNVLRFYNEFFGDFTSERLPIKFLFQLYQAWNKDENNPTNTKQNTFTKDLRSIVEPDGWEYHRKNYQPLKYFHETDEQIMGRYQDANWPEWFKVDRRKQQALISREKTK